LRSVSPISPQNAGALLRLGAFLGVPVDIIEPCGFALSDRRWSAPGWTICWAPSSRGTSPGRASRRSTAAGWL